MSLDFPIIIPSKGRAGKTKTDKLLCKAGFTFTFVVEPKEYESYSKIHKNVIVLPKDDMGITYSRSFILNNMRKNNVERFWMLDDDIECFGECINGKTIQSDATVLQKAFKQLSCYGQASLYCLELRQFAWSSKEVQRDKIAMQCVLFDLKNCQNIEYDLRLKIREDYDLTFQAIFKGKGTLKSGKYYYGIADMNSQKGGMSQWYNRETELEETRKLINKWPDLVKPVIKRGRVDVKINWGLLK